MRLPSTPAQGCELGPVLVPLVPPLSTAQHRLRAAVVGLCPPGLTASSPAQA